MLLIVSWFAYKLMPFVPSLDWQAIKDSVKPVFLQPVFDWLQFAQTLVGWLLVFYLAGQIIPALKKSHLLLLPLACFFLQVLIVNNVVTLANVAGGLTAFAIWLPLGKSRQMPQILLFSVSLLLLLKGLAPFTPTALSTDFHWLPFSGFLSNSMFYNTLQHAVFFREILFYGGFIWLLYSLGLNLTKAAMIAVLFLLGIEFAQRYVTQHTAEITDPVLAILIAFTFHLLLKKTTEPAKKAPDKSYTFTLIPLTSITASQLPRQGLQFTLLPFKVGRATSDEAPGRHAHGLRLHDYMPYQLSRDHFVILMHRGKPVLRDSRSTLGTTVNGIACAGQQNREVALKLGDNEIVAGKSRTDYRFNVHISLSETATEAGPAQADA